MALQAALPIPMGAQTQSRERRGVGDQLSPPSIHAHLSLFLHSFHTSSMLFHPCSVLPRALLTG